MDNLLWLRTPLSNKLPRRGQSCRLSAWGIVDQGVLSIGASMVGGIDPQ
jgi:hypothetical protein